MSRKSVPFTAPGGPERPNASAPRRPPQLIEARADEWVSDRNDGIEKPGPGAAFVVDLTAERSLAEVVALSFAAPVVLGGFWLLRAMMGRSRL